MKRSVVVIAALGLLWTGCKCVAGEDDAKEMAKNAPHGGMGKNMPRRGMGKNMPRRGMANSGTAGKAAPSPAPAANTATKTAGKSSPTPPANTDNKGTTAGTTKPAATTKTAGATKTAAAKPIDAKAMTEAQQIFRGRCANCHGMQGHGNGPVARALRPKPRNYSDVEWQKKTSDKTIATAIVKGGPAVGLSPTMPPNADLEQKPEVVRALVHIIRGFAGK